MEAVRLLPGNDATRDALIDAARSAARQAYASRSGVHVGAAVLSQAGRIYSGCNVENAAFPLGNCAEPAAIAAGVLAEGARFRIAEVGVWAEKDDGEPFGISPCGGCRKRITPQMMLAARIPTPGPRGVAARCRHPTLPDHWSHSRIRRGRS